MKHFCFMLLVLVGLTGCATVSSVNDAEKNSDRELALAASAVQNYDLVQSLDVNRSYDFSEIGQVVRKVFPNLSRQTAYNGTAYSTESISGYTMKWWLSKEVRSFEVINASDLGILARLYEDDPQRQLLLRIEGPPLTKGHYFTTLWEIEESHAEKVKSVRLLSAGITVVYDPSQDMLYVPSTGPNERIESFRANLQRKLPLIANAGE